jgi:membrane protein DedA with SNARE-associated domain
MLHPFFWVSSVSELIEAYGLWVVFTGITLECMGIPLPGETVLLAAALYAGSTHRLTIASVMLVASTAATVGGMIGYVIGRWIGLRMLLRYGKYARLDERRLKAGQYLFLRHGGKIVFFGRFVDPLRILAAVLAGANRMSGPYFMFMNATGSICWVLLLGGAAYLFGEQVKSVAGPVQLILLIITIALAGGGIVFFRHHEKELVQRADRAIPGPLFRAGIRNPTGTGPSANKLSVTPTPSKVHWQS